ncbi:uridine diphosphate-N-acetylglucosamine-binding protein YvcK [Gallaecimonas kandeliae]|uniref:uridine diphosphate-N-acetylglucosamine-binding protein YvcK n=1 Tax=Gallaecimonas kandeliae TaxID=3029055 RepID=UPI002648FBAB|nr:uridine diphosphate-N-acetylglucosamine-binding protein YvcK [Gallaecimonas kandeliae]WKE65833.1 uridine diphosphate-N-acetylglucosamine-binding protein YvcK [Gallaecimonas kandeliae]
MTEHPYRPHLAALERVVALGGGHGLGRTLSALSFLGPRLTGIVTTTDNGGSTGRLRQSRQCIAWGDVRNCLNQLITQDSTGSRLFEYRFGGEDELKGHNLGNLILLALDDLCVRPVEAINLVRQVLRVKCGLLPMTESPADLLALGADGRRHLGELSVDGLKAMPSQLSLSPQVAATREALDAVREADLLILGPGSFLTSVLPPLLLPDLAAAFRQSKALKVWVENLAPEQSPVRQLSAGARLAWLHERLDFPVVDWVLCPPGLDWQNVPAGVRRLEQPLASDQIFYRHDRGALADGLEKILASCG